MIEPSLVLQAAIRSALISSPAVTALVPPERINSGWMRPDELPCINIRDGLTEMRNRASGGYYVAAVALDVHVWAQVAEDTAAAKAIGAAVSRVLMDAPESTEPRAMILDFKHSRTVWPRDPNPEFGHGVLNVEAVIYWKF